MNGKLSDVTQALRNALAAQKYPIGSRFPSEYEITERYGCSRNLANKAVALLVHDGLLVRGIRGSGTYVRSTAVFPQAWYALIAGVSHPYFAAIAQSLQRCALDSNSVIALTEPSPEQFSNVIANLLHSDCSGIFTVGYHLLPTEIQIPIVYLDSILSSAMSENLNMVGCDNYSGACQMMEHIIKSGHREIVMTGRTTYSCRMMRRRGFLDTLHNAGFPDAENRYFELNNYGSDYDYCVRSALHDILKRHPRTTIIATDSDDDALRFLIAFRERGIRYPDQIALSGFGNLRGIADINQLPSVDQHPDAIGARAFSVMRKLVSCEQKPLPIREYVNVELVNKECLFRRDPPSNAKR